MNEIDLLEKINGIPVFVQVREKLREEVLSGKYLPNHQLPSEDELALNYGVSRMTLRRSIEELVKEGLLYRRHGRGTFIAHQRIDRDHSRLTSFFEDETSKGRVPRQEILSQVEMTPPQRVAKVLDLREGEPVFFIQLIQFSNSEPITLMDAYIPRKVCPDLLSFDLANQSLWRIIEQKGSTVRRAVQRIEARVATKQQAKVLGIAAGAPILYKVRTVYTDSGLPLEYIECFNRGDVVTVTSSLYR